MENGEQEKVTSLAETDKDFTSKEKAEALFGGPVEVAEGGEKNTHEEKLRQAAEDGERYAEASEAAKGILPNLLKDLNPEDQETMMIYLMGARLHRESMENMKKEPEILEIEIDKEKQKQSVDELTDTDFFKDLQAKGAEMRKEKAESSD